LAITAKKYLGQAFRLNLRITAKIEQLEHLHSLAYKVTSILREDRASNGPSSKSPLEDAIVKIVMAENQINKDVDCFVDIKNEITALISLIQNEDERLLLELRYLCFNSWEQIAAKMNYSYSYTFRLHKQALESFDFLLSRKEKQNG